jgi:hypothetical protein
MHFEMLARYIYESGQTYTITVDDEALFGGGKCLKTRFGGLFMKAPMTPPQMMAINATTAIVRQIVHIGITPHALLRSQANLCADSSSFSRPW